MSSKITMVGTRATGKTCYLYATYDRMMDGINGFRFIPTDHKKQLDLMYFYSEMADEGKFPASTGDNSVEYEFNCFHAGIPQGNFEWYDYRGGILTENDDTLYPELEGRFMESDALIVAMPADILMALKYNIFPQNDRGFMKEARASWRVYQGLLSKIHEKNPEIPIALTITKGDLLTEAIENDSSLSSEERQQKKKQIVTEVIQYIIEKFDFLFTKKSAPVMITRVSIGRYLLNEQGNREWEFNRVNVHLPVLFPVYLDLKRKLRIMQEEKHSHEDGAMRYENNARKDAMASGIVRWFRKSQITENHAKANQLRSEINQLKGKISDLQKVISTFEDELCQQIIFNGNQQIGGTPIPR